MRRYASRVQILPELLHHGRVVALASQLRHEYRLEREKLINPANQAPIMYSKNWYQKLAK
jgi:hypothetical protein